VTPGAGVTAVDSSSQGAIRKRGRTIGNVAFAAIVTLFTVVCSIQILQQAWAIPAVPANAPVLECRAGLSALISAIHRARTAASKVSGEHAALATFRDALLPEWSTRPAFDERCAGDADALQSLGEIDRLRYAEEHALRYEALDVAGRRTRVRALETELHETR
jgi:hypothetical protein